MGGRFAVLVAALALAGAAVLVALSLQATGGALVYTLDDPYIHLALADQILQGGYGINAGEAAAPSSSILYPVLLALLLVLGLDEAAPLVLALAGQVALGALLGLACAASVPSPGAGARGWLWPGFLAVLLVLAVNGLALPMTGMEHTLHAAVSVAVILGLARLGARGGKAAGAGATSVPVWLIAAIWLAPALRFEGAALALAAALTLLALGHRRAGWLALGGLAVLALAFGGLMLALGLPVLPSSVLVKSAASAAVVGRDGEGALVAVIVNAILNLRRPQGLLLALCALALLFAAWRRPALRAPAIPAALAIAAHLVAGRFGWFARYEIYAVAIALAALGVAFAPRGWVLAPVAAAFALTYLPPIARTPAAALAVHQQHHQMHRFATAFFPHPVAVNDLGFVAWRNPARVIDLWGLGSETARRLAEAADGRTPAVLHALTEGEAVYAMIYDPAFPAGLPESWCHVATLETSPGELAWHRVSFHLIDPARMDEMRAALDAWSPGLPPGATVSIHDCGE